MLKVVFLSMIVVVCLADIPVSPPQDTPSPPVFCGKIPNAIIGCLGNPKIIKTELSAHCIKSVSECEKINCIFRHSGWFTSDNKVDRQKVTAHFDQFAKENPDWLPAVQHVKTACLTTELPAQGVYTNCPAYDIVHCSLSGFFKNAQSSQWSSSQKCVSAQHWAASCPVCPSDCFEPAVPYGSCNACRLLPQTP